MYESFYGFKERPFTLLPDPDFLFLSEHYREALHMLETAVSDRSGFCVISGEIGSGKTTLIRELLNRLDETVCVGLVSNTHPSFGELMHWVVAAYGLPIGDGDTRELHKQFVEFAIQQHAQNKHTLLIIDEAQNLTMQALEELRMLSNENSDKDLILQVILVGQHQLRDKLQQPELDQFSQRIAFNYHLEALSQDETCGYIQHRVSHAGGETGLFSAEACQLVYKLSGGIPRLINRLCDLSLVYGCTAENRVITAELVERASEDQRMSALREIPQGDSGIAEPEVTVQPVDVSAEEKTEPDSSSDAPGTGEQPEKVGTSTVQMEEAASTPSNTIVGEPNPPLLQEKNTAAKLKETVSETDAALDLQKMVEAHRKRVRSQRNAMGLLLGVIVMAGGAGWLIGDFQSGQVDAFKERAASTTTTLPPVVTKEVAEKPPVSADSQAVQPDASSPEEKDSPQLTATDSADLMKNGTVKDTEAEENSLQKAEEERMAQQRAAELKDEAEANSLQQAEERMAEQRAAELRDEAEAISLQKAEEERMAQQRAAELKREVEETARLKEEFDRMEGKRRVEEQKLVKQRAARKELERKLRLERKRLAAAREAAKKLAEERAPAEAGPSEAPLAKSSSPQKPKRPAKAMAIFDDSVPSAYDEDDGDEIVLETKKRIAGAVAGFQDALPAAYDEDDGDAIVQDTKEHIVGRPVPVLESAK